MSSAGSYSNTLSCKFISIMHVDRNVNTQMTYIPFAQDDNIKAEVKIARHECTHENKHLILTCSKRIII